MTALTLLASLLLLSTVLFLVLRTIGPWGSSPRVPGAPASARRRVVLGGLALGAVALGAAGALMSVGSPAESDARPVAGPGTGSAPHSVPVQTGGGSPSTAPSGAPAAAPSRRITTEADALAATAAALAQTTAERRQPTPAAPAANAPDIDALLARLQQRLERQPDDADGWAMLAHSNASLERYADATRAYARAVALRPKDAQLKADWADAAAMAQGGSAKGEPTRLLDEALSLDPDNVKARVMAGLAALERADPPAARRHFEAAAAAAPPDSTIARAMRERLAAMAPAPAGAR